MLKFVSSYTCDTSALYHSINWFDSFFILFSFTFYYQFFFWSRLFVAVALSIEHISFFFPKFSLYFSSYSISRYVFLNRLSWSLLCVCDSDVRRCVDRYVKDLTLSPIYSKWEIVWIVSNICFWYVLMHSGHTRFVQQKCSYISIHKQFY